MEQACSTGWKRVNGRFRRIAETELGEEQLCTSCQELWPLDQEFYAVARGTMGYECRACAVERQRTDNRVGVTGKAGSRINRQVERPSISSQ